jgi:hypothetical protein
VNNHHPHETGPNPMPNPYAYGGQPGPYPSPQPRPDLPYSGGRPPKKKHTGLKIFALISAVVVAGAVACTAAVTNSAQDAIDNLPNVVTPEPGTPTPTIHATAGPKKVSPPAVLHDGVLLVGKDVKAGTFRATVPSSELGTSVPSCYVARLRGTSGELGDIITNQNRYPGDVVTVTVRASDAAVEVHGCGKWVRIK